MHARTAWQALTRRRFLASSWPWRSSAYLLSSAPIGAAALLVFVTLLVSGAALAVVLVGIPLLVALGLAGIPVAALERRRLRLVDLDPAGSPHRRPARPGLRGWLTTRYSEPATWRELAFTLVFVTVLWPLDLLAWTFALTVPAGLLAAPALMATIGGGEEARLLKEFLVTSYPQAWLAALVGLVTLPIAAYATAVMAGGRATLTRLLLAPREDELGAQVVELTRSRARLVDAFQAERRRIERDLHDGAQQRLVALSMTLGLARLSEGTEAAHLVDKAHGEARLVLAELRELIHGIYPQVLTDRGLPAAVIDVADRSPVPVDVTFDLPCRLPDAVEAAAYFVVCEALVNVARHSGARRATVAGRFDRDRLLVRIEDDGAGGADAARGTGLSGLADRVAVVNGRIMLSSPPGGPTLLHVEIPCDQTAACG